MYFPLINYTHFSRLRGYSKPHEIVKKCVENNYRSAGIADYKSISGAIDFYQECVKNNIKPIIGCSFDSFILFAKNKEGWLDLIKIVSSIDTDGNINQGYVTKLCKTNNLISIADNEALSPILGEDFYLKRPYFHESYYTNKEDAELHQILLCSALKTTLPKVRQQITKKDFDHPEFFERDNFNVLDNIESTELLLEYPESSEIHKQIFDKCTHYNILSKPMLPTFDTPNGESEEEYLKQMCREGWESLLIKEGKVSSPEKKQEYLNRFSTEFEVIKDANLFGYFLIVADIIHYAQSKGWMTGPGRGSAAGCLISYLIGITQIDPIEYDLIFERFYNSGRNTKDSISLPDIDIDIPGNKRDQIIEYIKDRYGHDRVSQMITFGRLKGKSVLKEVLRVNQACGFSQMNEITKYIPDEAKISDQLELMDEEDRSIIRWALMNNQEDLQPYCHLNSKGELKGDYAKYFDQSIKMEGTIKTQGKHAAGVVISAVPLHEVCPMINSDTSKEKIAGLEMNALEALGHVKFDILAINFLDKMMYTQELIDNPDLMKIPEQ